MCIAPKNATTGKELCIPPKAAVQATHPNTHEVVTYEYVPYEEVPQQEFFATKNQAPQLMPQQVSMPQQRQFSSLFQQTT